MPSADASDSRAKVGRLRPDSFHLSGSKPQTTPWLFAKTMLRAWCDLRHQDNCLISFSRSKAASSGLDGMPAIECGEPDLGDDPVMQHILLQ